MSSKKVATPLKIGFGTADITPPLGAEMPGCFSRRLAVGVHDPLAAKAILLDDGATLAAVVQVDCLSLKRSVVQRALALVAEWCSEPVHVLAAATHTHSGGPTSDCLGSTSDPKYCDFLAHQIARAVTYAHRSRTPARLGIGSGHEETVAFNRRFHMRNGREATHPGKGNPDILQVAGPIDPEVGVLGAWSSDGAYLGALVSYTCHSTCMGAPEFSADWPAHLDRTLRGAMGAESTTVFINGAYGDVTQVSNTLLREPEFGEKWARRVGMVVAGEAIRVLASMEPRDTVRIQASSAEVLLTPRTVPAEELAAARRLLAEEGPWDTERWYARELTLLDALNHTEPQVPAEVQVLAFDEAAVAAIPGELFCQLGLDLKAASPFPRTWIAGTANGCVGYLPTRAAMGPTGGGYEPRLCRSSKLEPEAGHTLTGTALRLLHSLEPPVTQQAEPLTSPVPAWEVGASRPGT